MSRERDREKKDKFEKLFILLFTFVVSVSVKWKSRITGVRDNVDDICSSTDGQTKPIVTGHDTLA